MKKLIVLVTFLLSFVVMDVLGQTKQAQVKVDGLSCPFCAYGLEKKIKNLDGVENLKIDVENGMMTFEIKDGKTVTEEKIRKKIKEAGFTPREITFIAIPEKKE